MSGLKMTTQHKTIARKNERSIMNDLKKATQRKAILAAVKKAPQGGDYVWDGKDKDDRPLTREEMLKGVETYRKYRGRPISTAKPVTTLKTNKKLFVEKRPEGDFAVRKGNSERASDVLPTQAEAIERAKQLNPGASPVVERVRNTTAGKPDQWRKV